MSESQRSAGDHYDTLGVPRDASTEEIKKAFRKLARECHPDVAGDDPKTQARFTKVREAYETLVDPVRRATYDRRGYSTYFAGPGRQGGKWRPPGGFDFEQVGDPSPGRRQGAGSRGGRRNPANDIGLEDIFGDFGGGDFGFGGQPKASDANRGTWGRPGSSGPVGSGSPGSGSPGSGSPGSGPAGSGPAGSGPVGSGSPRPGRDIHMKVDVPQAVADSGGTVTLSYPRLLRGDDGHSLHRYDEIHDLRVPPGVRRGDTLRVPSLGDAGADGGPYGDLVCDLTVVPDEQGQEEPQVKRGQRRRATGPGPAPRSAPRTVGPAAAGDEVHAVDISIVEALLGGRIKVDTPAGPVHVTVPSCTSSGTRLRLRGRGKAGVDHYVELRIVTPGGLDGESRALIERFAELNPVGPRDEV